jgi:hypothetical protein
MNIEHEIIKLIGQLKKENDPEKKKKIKQKLKQLYRQLNRVRQGKKDMKVEFKLPIKKDVEELLSGQRDDVNKIRNKLSAMKKGVDITINQLKTTLSKERDEGKRNDILIKLKKEEAKRQTLIILAKHMKNIDPNDLNENLKFIDNIEDENSLMMAIGHLMETYNLNENNLEKIFVEPGFFENIGFTLDDVLEQLKQNIDFIEPVLDIQQEAEEEEKEEGEFKEGEDPSFEEKRKRHARNVADLQSSLKRLSKAEKQDEPPFDIDEALDYIKKARENLESRPQLELSPSSESLLKLSKGPKKEQEELEKYKKQLFPGRPPIPSEVSEIAAEIKGRKKGISSFGSMLNPLKWWGLGKRKKTRGSPSRVSPSRCVKGGAGISDYLSVLGNMPGLSQMAGMVPIIGPMLGPAIGLAQTGSNIASQGMKEAGLGPGEQVKGLFGTIGKLFGFGKNKQLSPMGEEFLKLHASGGALHPFYKKHKSKLNKAGIHSLQSLKALKGSGFLSDLMGTIGGITPHLSSLLGFIPGAGPILQMGNSAIGSATRVGEDVLKKIGLGKKRKGGRKMLPNPFTPDGLYPEMNDTRLPVSGEPEPLCGMAYIQPYYGSGNLPNGGNVSEEFEDQLNQQIVQLLKNRHLDEIRNTDAFNAQLAAKTNTEQQSAVFQLLYAKLLKDAAQEEERRRQE